MENNMHRPRYSLPPQAIVGGRYLVREFLEEQENQLVYLAYDLVEKKQVRLAECYPKALVQRKGEAGEEDMIIRPRREPKVEEIQRQFEKKYKQVIRDHHTVYAVLPLNKKKPMGAIALCMAVIVLGAGMLAAIFFSEKSKDPVENSQDIVITYEDNDYIMRPSEDRICQEETSGAKYYDRMVTAFLRREPSEDELQALVDSVNGTLTGRIRGAVDYVQIELPESGFDKIQQAAEMLMENELVRYADCDYPVDICENVDETDTNPWSKKQNSKGCKYDEGKPGGNNWWAECIGAYTAWGLKSSVTDHVIVGIIDSGFNFRHEDLQGQTSTILKTSSGEDRDVVNWNHVLSVKNEWYSTYGDHGTHVTGIIGAVNNNIGIRGVADDAQLLVASWRLENGTNNALSSGEYVAMEEEMIARGAKVVNNSWGQTVMSDTDLNELRSCDEYTAKTTANMIIGMLEKGYTQFLFVQSAGNGLNREGKIGLDSCYNSCFASVCLLENSDFWTEHGEGYTYEDIRDHIMIVGSMKRDRKGRHVDTGYNYGNDVDIYAPGREIYSTLGEANKNKYGKMSGTSMAAPMVTASAALLWQEEPMLTVDQVKDYLLQNGRTLDITYDKSGGNAEFRPEHLSQTPVGLSIGDAMRAMKIKEAEDRIAVALPEYLKNTLIPQYGIMSTDSWKLDDSLPTWSKGDDSPADGILSALIEDFDRDGEDELLVVRFEKEDNKKLYLEVFENYDGAVELATGAQFDIDWLCRTCQNNRFSVFAEKKDGMCRIYLYAFQRGNGGGDESIVQLEYEQVMMPQITLENYWSFRMGSDGTASVQSGTLKLNEINQVVGLWDYGQGTDQAESDYEETAGAPYESDSYPEAFIGMLEDFYGNLEETTGLVHKTELPQYLGDDSIGIYVSADDVYSGEMLYTAKNLFEEDSNTIWIASLDNHMYHDLSSNTIENTMIPQDYTGIVR